MAGITLEQAQSQLDAYLAAEIAVLGGQQYEIGGRMLRRADLKDIHAGIDRWEKKVAELSGRSSRIPRAISPRVGF